MNVRPSLLAGIAAAGCLLVQTPAVAEGELPASVATGAGLHLFFRVTSATGDGFVNAVSAADPPYALQTLATPGGEALADDDISVATLGDTTELSVTVDTAATVLNAVDRQSAFARALKPNPGVDVLLASIVATGLDWVTVGYDYSGGAFVEQAPGFANAAVRFVVLGRERFGGDESLNDFTFDIRNAAVASLDGQVNQFSGEATHSFAVDAGTTYDFFLRRLDVYAYALAVPEPQAWTLMILGFACVGGALRRRRAELA